VGRSKLLLAEKTLWKTKFPVTFRAAINFFPPDFWQSENFALQKFLIRQELKN
jgi:hypothetical protein